MEDTTVDQCSSVCGDVTESEEIQSLNSIVFPVSSEDECVSM